MLKYKLSRRIVGTERGRMKRTVQETEKRRTAPGKQEAQRTAKRQVRKSAQEAAEEKTGQSVQLTAKRQIEQTKQAAKEPAEEKIVQSGQLTAGRKTGQMKQTKRAAQEVSAKEKKADQSGHLKAEKPVRQTKRAAQESSEAEKKADPSGHLKAEKPVRQTKRAVKESSVTGEKTRQSQHLTLETYIEQTMQSGQVTAEEKTGLTRKSAQRSTKQQQKSGGSSGQRKESGKLKPLKQLNGHRTSVRSKQAKKKLALAIIERLKQEYPLSDCTLEYDEAWKLLVSVRLAAQCTDARVNVVVQTLYEKFPDINALAAAPAEEIEELVRPCGLGRSKARDISACMKVLRDRYGGKVPEDFDALLALPGVGRKSANLIMGDVFGKPAIVTDTHCIRLTNRMGLVDGITEPKKVEMALWELIPPEEGNSFCHRLVDHGRAVCTARTSPYCDKCCIQDICRKKLNKK